MTCTQGRNNRLATAASHRTAQPLGAAWHARRATEFAEAVFAKVIFQERPFFVRSSRRRGFDLPVVSGRLYPWRIGRLSGLFIRKGAPYRLTITLTGKNRSHSRHLLAPHAASRHSLARQLSGCETGCAPSLFQIHTFFRPLHPGRPIRFSGTPCVFRASLTVFMRPRLCLLHFRALCGSFLSPVQHFQMPPFLDLCNSRRSKRFCVRTMQKGLPAAPPPALCTLPRSGFVLVSLCSGRTFALPFTLGRPIALLKATLCDAIVCRRGCKTRFYTRAIYHYAWQSKGNAPPFLQQSPA